MKPIITPQLKRSLLILHLIAVFLSFSSLDAKASPQDYSDNAIRMLLIPQTETVFSSEIAASIKKITVDFGEHFKKGQKLIEFDCEMYRAEQKKAKAELTEASKTHEVNSQLEKLMSISELEVAVSEARRDRARAEVELKETQVGKCIIAAPFSGKTIKLVANQYQYVVPGQPLLEVISEVNLVQLFVPSEWLNRLKPGLIFSLYIDETGKRYKAAITVLGAKVDQVSQTLEVRAAITGHHPELLAGMSGTAYF